MRPISSARWGYASLTCEGCQLSIYLLMQESHRVLALVFINSVITFSISGKIRPPCRSIWWMNLFLWCRDRPVRLYSLLPCPGNGQNFIVSNGCYQFITVFNKVPGSIIGSLVIIDDYFVSRYFIHDPVEENDGISPIMQFLKIAEVLCFRSHWNEQAIYGSRSEVMEIDVLPVKWFPALRIDNIITVFVGNGFNAVNGLRKKAIGVFLLRSPRWTGFGVLSGLKAMDWVVIDLFRVF